MPNISSFSKVQTWYSSFSKKTTIQNVLIVSNLCFRRFSKPSKRPQRKLKQKMSSAFVSSSKFTFPFVVEVLLSDVVVPSQFHQHFTCSFYALRSQKRKTDSQLKQLLALSGSAGVKAACKRVDEIDPHCCKKVMVALIIGKHFNGLFPSQFFCSYFDPFFPPSFKTISLSLSRSLSLSHIFYLFRERIQKSLPMMNF